MHQLSIWLKASVTGSRSKIFYKLFFSLCKVRPNKKSRLFQVDNYQETLNNIMEIVRLWVVETVMCLQNCAVK